jgi:hypothetical protein
VLSTSSNWLILRYLSGLLDDQLSNRGSIHHRSVRDGQIDESTGKTEDGDGCSVVLVSWMRGAEWWRTEARKSVVCIPGILFTKAVCFCIAVEIFAALFKKKSKVEFLRKTYFIHMIHISVRRHTWTQT